MCMRSAVSAACTTVRRMRSVIKILLVLSLWWSAAAPAVAAAMGCCEPETPCCLVQGLGRACTVCPPAALHVSATPQPAGDAGRHSEPVARVPFQLNSGTDDIWRPPWG